MISQEISTNPPSLPQVHLSKYNTDFELVLSKDLLSIKTRNDDGYEWLWRSK